MITKTKSKLNKPRLTASEADSVAETLLSASRLIARQDTDSQTQLMLLRSMLARKQGRVAEGKAAAETAVKNIKNTTNMVLIGEVWYELAEYYDFDLLNQTLYHRIDCLSKAAAAFEKGKDFRQLAECYRWLADMHHYLSKNDQAMNEVGLSLKYYHLAGYHNIQGAYTIVAKICNAQGNLKQALKFGLLALETGEQAGDTTAIMCQISNNLGSIYFKLNDNRNALKYFLHAVDLAKQAGDNQTAQMVATSVVGVYIKMDSPKVARSFFTKVVRDYPVYHVRKYQAGDYALDKAYFKIFMTLKKYDKAAYYSRQLLVIASDPGLNRYILSSCYANAIEYFIAVKDYRSAEYYLEKNMQVLTELKDDINQANNFAAWVHLDSAKNDYKSAYTHLKKFGEINNAIYNAAKAREIQQINIQFQTDKKESELKGKDQQINLLLQNQQLQTINLKKSNLVTNITLAAIGLLLIVAGLFYRQFKQKQKVNEMAVRNNDIILKKNGQLNHLLQEKEWLLKEVHHRVKNNLQIVMGLLSSQAGYLESNEVLEVLTESQNRVQAIALIHQKLYNTSNVASLHMPSYVSDLVNNLSDCFDTVRRQIKFVCLIEAIELNLTQAVPFGLIVNEAVTNSIKYAFPEGCGDITIDFHRKSADVVILTISDNGKGLPIGYDIYEATSLGIEMMKGLSKQLGGNFKLQNKDGVTITVEFRVEEMRYDNLANLQANIN